MLNYILWDVTPEIIEGFRVRWYGLLFAIGFMTAYYILKYIFKQEKKSSKELDSMTFTAFVSLVIGLRLGHCLFYEPAQYLSNPIRILYIWEGGLASHGGAIGLLIGFFIYSRKFKVDYLWVVSRAAIVIPLTGALVRLGNLMNSEIYGIATDLPWAFVYLRDSVIQIPVAELKEILASGGLIPEIHLPILDELLQRNALYFQKGMPYNTMIEMLHKNHLLSTDKYDTLAHIFVNKGYLVPKHPTQIYEALAYFITFFVLIGLYIRRIKKGIIVNSEQILGIMIVMIFTARFFIEYIKNVQVDFEETLPLTMGQILSIPFILAGIALIYWGYYKKKQLKIS